MTTTPKIVLIGCGKMGASLLQSWLDHNIDAGFIIIEPNNIAFDTLTHHKNIDEAQNDIADAACIIMAVKPQIMDTLCTDLKPHLSPNTLILSIAAGQTIETFEQHFGNNQPIIRAMPNTPAAIGKGMSVALTNTNVKDEQKHLADTLLASAGKIEWLDDETLLDAVTALSGSGPAYVFHLIETLTKAGTTAGLPENLAKTLARQTVIGSAALAEHNDEIPAETLRQNVTSPGGTTEAALNVLMDGRLQKIYNEALEAATKRGQELNT